MGKKLISILLAIAMSISCFLPVMARRGDEVVSNPSSVPIFALDDFSDSLVGASEVSRAIVLVLDNSGSMASKDENGVTAIANLKAASKSFCKTVLNNTDDTAIGLVKFSNVNGERTKKIAGLTQSYSKLETAIDKELFAAGTTDIYDGMSIAKKMLDKSTASQKFIVLMTDGVPEVDVSELEGHSYLLRDKGPYDEETLVKAFPITNQYYAGRNKYYNKLMNAIVNYCNKIKKSNYSIYTVGYFGLYESGQKKILKGFLERLASQPSYYYDASKIDKLSKIFRNIAQDIVNPVSATLSSSLISTHGNIVRYEIKATITNPNKKNAVKNVFAKLDAKDASISKGEATQTTGQLDPLGKVTFTWEVDIDKTKHTDNGKYSYAVEVGAKDTNSSTLSDSIVVTKLANEIECEKVSIPWNGKETKVAIKATAKGGTLTYKSNTKGVVVDDKGNLTVKAGFVGLISITISTTGNERYEPASETITVNVQLASPMVTSLRQVDTSKYGVEWKQYPKLGGYEIVVTTDKEHENITYHQILKGASNNSTTIIAPEHANGFYIRIRSFKSYEKRVYYSRWNNITVGNPQ